ncbi:MAG: DUF2142 domain-containing protein [Acidimicrobiia bacterium]
MRLRVFLLAFVAFGALGITWAFASPPLSNPDEPAHSVKAAATVRGQFVPPKEQQPDEGKGSLLRGGFTTRVNVPYSYTWQTSKLPLCYIYDADATAGCAPHFDGDATVICKRFDPRPPESCPPKFDDDRELTRWVTLIGRYPPPYYLAIGWPTRFDTGEISFYAMRVLSALLNAALLGLAVACAAAATRLRFMVVGVLVATTPEALVLAGAINPNSIEISAAICTWVAATVAVLGEGERRCQRQVLAALTVGAVALAWSRALGTLWLLVIAIVVLLAFGNRARLATRLHGRGERVALGVIALASVGAVAWTFGADVLGNQSGYEPRGLGLVDATTHSLGLTVSYLRQMVAVFGWQREPSPVWLSMLWGLAALALVAVAVWPDRWARRRAAPRDGAAPGPATGVRARWTILGLTVLVVLLPTIMQAPTAPDFGFVWSGRYGIAIAAGVPILAAAVISARGVSPNAMKALAGSVVAAVGLGQVVAHWENMRRYVVGLNGPVFYLGHDGWTPPLGAPLLLAVVVAASTGLAWLGYRLAVGTPAAVADR